MTPRNLLTEWSRFLIETLTRCGVREAVISPGSRSTPFTAAALRCAALECHSVIDERSAAFFALGMAKVTGRPALLICTSGTAGAHYLPAVIEAEASGVPLLVLTADRPRELLECSAPQTIDQAHLFGRHVRRFTDLGSPSGTRQAFAALRRRLSQAMLATRHPLPGPVHLNAPAAKPLEPVELAELDSAAPEELELHDIVAQLLTEPSPTAHFTSPACSTETLDVLIDRLRSSRRGLIVAGRREIFQKVAHSSSEVPTPLRLAERCGLPILLEAPSQMRLRGGGTQAIAIDAIGSVVQTAWSTEQATSSGLPLPDFVLELGAPLTSGAWASFAQRLPAGVRHVVHETDWPDPQNNLTELIVADPWQLAADLVDRWDQREGAKTALDLSASPETDLSWSGFLRKANEQAWSAIEDALGQAATLPEEVFPEPLAVRAVVGALPANSVLALGNSLAIREVDWVCPRGSADVDVWVQRGANGIDGLIAGASGAAHVSGRPTCLLLGDVSALHDLSSLAVARRVETPLLVVVLDNGGGKIFSLLPFAEHAQHRPDVWKFWSTPPEIDWQAAALAFGIRYRCCRSAADIHDAVREALGPAAQRPTLLRIPVESASAEQFLRALPPQTAKRLTP